MPETFYVGEQKYNIPDDLTTNFLNENPDAVKGLNYVVDDKTYSIPPTLQEQFTQQNPNAILQEAPLEQKTIKSDITYQDEQLNALNQRIVSNIDNRLKFKVQEPEPEAVEPIAGEYTMRAAPEIEPTTFGNFQNTVKNVFKKAGLSKTTTAKNVESQLQYEISKQTGLPLSYVAENYDELITNPEITGISSDPTALESIEFAFQGAVAVGLATHPIATAMGVGAFMALDEAENVIISAVQDDPYVFGGGKNISDLLPEDASRAAKETVEIIDLLAKGAIIGAGRKQILKGTGLEGKILPQAWKDAGWKAKFIKNPEKFVWEKIAKEYITEYSMPPTMYIDPAKAKAILVTGDKAKFSPVEAELLTELGIEKGVYKQALKDGITIEVPTEKVVRLVDKSWWAKAKGIFGIEKAAELISREQVGRVRETVRGVLPAYEETIDVKTGESKVTYPAEKAVTPEKPVKPEVEPVEAPKEPVTPVEPTVVEPKVFTLEKLDAQLKPKETVADISARHKDDPTWTEEDSKVIYESNEKRYKEFKKDPIAYLEQDIKNTEAYLKEGGVFSNPEAVKKSVAQEKALLAELKKEAAVEVTPEAPVEKPTVGEPYTYPKDYDTKTITGFLEGRTFKTKSGRNIEIVRETNETVDYKYVDDAKGKITKVKKGMFGDKLSFHTKRQPVVSSGGVVRYLDPSQVIPTKPTIKEAVKKEQVEGLNKQYTDLLNAQAAAQTNLMREGLAGMQKQQLEQSFEQSTKRLEDLELEAKTKGITLEKKITETEAIKEVVDLFKELDPEVDYQTKLDELRTLQDNIDDPLSPETPENALAQIEAAGQELAGVEPADIKIAGENYQELRDGSLVDVVKLHQGADIGTVVEERAELWYKQQEELNPKFDKTITEERRKYHERTGEKDDPSQSNGEWFSDRAKDNAIGAKPKGKVGDALTRIFRKFREYADALRKSASRFAKYVKQGKVSKELKSFLDRSVAERIKTPEQVAAAMKKKKPKEIWQMTRKEFREQKITGEVARLSKDIGEPANIHMRNAAIAKLTLEIGHKVSKEVPGSYTDLQKAVDYYAKKYNLGDIQLVESQKMKKQDAHAALATVKEGDVERFVILINPDLSGHEALGHIRHEIEHLKDRLHEDFRGDMTWQMKLIDKALKGGLTSADAMAIGREKHHKYYRLFETDYLHRAAIKKALKEGKDIPANVLKEYQDSLLAIETPEQIHAELMKDVKGEPSPTKISYSLKKTKEIRLPSKRKNRGVTFIAGDPANINLKGEYEDFGIRYPRTYKGWALNSSAAVTKLLNDTKAGYNVVGITSLVDAKGSMVKNRAYLNALYRELENKVGKRKAKSLLDRTGDIFQAVKEAKISAVQVAKDTAVPDFAQIARKVVAVATIKDFRTGSARKNIHPEYDIEVNFDKYLELPEPIDLDTFVEALPKTDSRVANPFYAAKQYWLTVLNQESPQVQMLSDFAATGDASIFGVKPEAYQFASPQIKAIGLPEAIEGIKSKKLQQYHRSIAEVEVELGIKSMTTAALGEWATGAEPSVMTTITEPVSYEKREYLAAVKGLMGNQEAVLDFEVNPEGADNLFRVNLDIDLKGLSELVKILSEEGIQYKTLPVKGNKVDLIVVDEGGGLVNSVNQITRKYNAETKLQKGRKTDIGVFGNRARADKRYVEIIRKYEGDTGYYSKVLRDRLSVHRPRFNRRVLPKKPRPTYELKKITPDERKLREEKKRKLAELIDEGVEAVREQIPEFIKNRRAELSLTSFETNSFLNDIKQITTPEQRELIPFLLERATKIPKNLKRPDLEGLMQDKKLVENLQPVVESFRQRYKELWKRLAKENAQLSNKEIKDYVTHIWDVPANKKSDVARWFSTYNKFTEKRYIETLTEGIDKYDLKPKYTDINDIYNIYASIANNSLANKKFVADIRKLNVGGSPLITMPQHAPDGWSEIHHPAMKNPFTQTYYKVHPDIVDPLKVVLGERIEGGRVLAAYEALNGVLKQMQLALSLFHKVALSETAAPIVSYRDLPKMLGVMLKTPWKGFIKMETDVFKNQPLAIDYIKHGGQIGVSADIPVQKIASQLKGLEVKFKDTPLAGQATKLINSFYERWNFALWDYLHDHYKLYAYESLVSRYKGDNIDTFKYEAAAMANDTFGGQNWDVLMVNPKTAQVMSWFLLSPDWTVSTIKQALAPTGIGSATKTKEGKKMRAKMGRRFWLKAMLYYGALINTLNTLNRKKDMEDNPDYYPDKDDYGFWDYTMFGNTIGSQTRLFVGRYDDGSERYLRWGKQFRELPELFYDETGFNFPQAALKKLGGKTAPLVQTITQIFTGKSPSGFDNYDLKDKKGTEWLYGLTKTLMKTPLPFSTQAALDKTKEWKFSNIAVPSSRGMTARKAGDLMEIALTANDEEMMRQIFIGCSRNKINGLGILEGTMSRMKRDYRIEETRMLRKADQLEAKANDSKTRPVDKAYLMKQAAMMRTNSELAQKPQALYKIGLAKLQEGKILFPDVFGELTKDEIDSLKKK